MANLSSYQVEPLQNWHEFESLCRDLWREIWKDPNTQKHGRLGQNQHGVDVYGWPAGSTGYHGVQCKSKSGDVNAKLTVPELETEVKQALTFSPPLVNLIIATSGPKDSSIERYAREISAAHQTKGLFMVTVLGWHDILSLLDDYESVAKKYYPHMFSSGSLNKKQEALIQAKNPTKLAVTGLNIQSFLGDSEPFLTVEVENISELEATNLEVSIILPVQQGEKESKVATFTPSKCIDLTKMNNAVLPAGEKLPVPVAPISEANRILSRDFIGQTLVGVGLSPEIPAELPKIIRSKLTDCALPCISINSIGFGVQVKWKSIFEQQHSLVTCGFLYYWEREEANNP